LEVIWGYDDGWTPFPVSVLLPVLLALICYYCVGRGRQIHYWMAAESPVKSLRPAEETSPTAQKLKIMADGFWVLIARKILFH
jgi:hypothetical protein